MGILAHIIANYLTSKSKTSYRFYFKKYVTHGSLYDKILDILSAYASDPSIYGTCEDPRDNNTGFLANMVGDSSKPSRLIAADILCFSNKTSFYDYSDFGTMRVRVYYDLASKSAVIMCQKRHQLKAFVERLSDPKFDIGTLVFRGVA
jgi:hypothetical protein